MDGFDLPLRDQDETLGQKRRLRFPRAADTIRKIANEPILWLCGVVVVVFLFDFLLHTVCGDQEDFCGGPGRTSLSAVVLLSLVLGGLALKEAFARYLLSSTQFLAAMIAALPLAHFLATDHEGEVEIELPASVDLSPLELALTEARAEMMMLEERLREVEARQELPGDPLPSIEDVREIAAEEAARLAAAEPVRTAASVEPPSQRERTAAEPSPSAGLTNLGERIAAAGPVLRESAQPPEPLDEELLFVAERLQFTEVERGRLARNRTARTCIATRMAERGFFAAFNQRINRDRLAAYLSVCLDDIASVRQ